MSADTELTRMKTAETAAAVLACAHRRNENAAAHPGELGEQANAAAGEQGEGKARRRYGVFHRFATENEWKAADEKQRA